MNITDKNTTTNKTYIATEFNEFKNETQNAAESSGQTLASNSTQLKQAMARYAGNADAYVDSGAADAYVLNPIANAVSKTNDAPSAYINLQKCKFVAGNTNTGASTVNVAGVGVVSIKTDSWTSGLLAGDIEAGKVYELIYSLSDNSFELIKINDAGLASEARPQDIERGMILSNNTSIPLNDIDISIGTKADSTFTDLIILSSILRKKIDANWVVGNNQGGFPSGLTLAIDTWYHVFAIYNTTSGITDAGFDTSLTATNLLADATGYTEYRYLGTVLTDGSSHIIPGIWHDLGGGTIKFVWDSIISDQATISFHNTRINKTVSLPLGIKTDGIFNIRAEMAFGTNSLNFIVTDPDQTDVAPTTTLYTLNAHRTADWVSDSNVQIISTTNTSSEIGVRSDLTGAAGTYSIATAGYIYKI